ncbi:LOW QUALITY PROTEIN: hypothetical protein RJ640_023132, partial [Escallonia rubra]
WKSGQSHSRQQLGRSYDTTHLPDSKETENRVGTSWVCLTHPSFKDSTSLANALWDDPPSFIANFASSLATVTRSLTNLPPSESISSLTRFSTSAALTNPSSATVIGKANFSSRTNSTVLTFCSAAATPPSARPRTPLPVQSSTRNESRTHQPSHDSVLPPVEPMTSPLGPSPLSDPRTLLAARYPSLDQVVLKGACFCPRKVDCAPPTRTFARFSLTQQLSPSTASPKTNPNFQNTRTQRFDSVVSPANSNTHAYHHHHHYLLVHPPQSVALRKTPAAWGHQASILPHLLL